jgi:hypothetical protein
MMVGGIPYYLRYFRRGMSLAQNADALFFADRAPLKEEFGRLFSSLFAKPGAMISIVEALNTKARGLTRAELLNTIGTTDSGEFSRHLKVLITGDFVTKYHSFGNGKREAFYKLTDPFCLFWLRFVRDAGTKSISWINMADRPNVVAWRGYAFENVCWNHVRQIKAALGISGVSTSESLWSKRAAEGSRGTQIDLIIDRRDNVVNLCEAKFTSDEFSVDRDYHFTLVRRGELLRDLIPKRSVIHNTLVTTYGLRYGEYSGDFVSVVTMEDLYAI